jgi:hypothetical protein
MSLQERTERICDTVDERIDEDIAAREARFGEVRDDHASYGVGVYKASVEDKGHKMMTEDDGLKVQIHRDKNPRGSEGQETRQSLASVLATFASSLDNVLCTSIC